MCMCALARSHKQQGHQLVYLAANYIGKHENKTAEMKSFSIGYTCTHMKVSLVDTTIDDPTSSGASGSRLKVWDTAFLKT